MKVWVSTCLSEKDSSRYNDFSRQKDGYCKFIAKFIWELIGNSPANSLVDVVKFESIGWQNQFVPFRKGFLFNDVDEGILELTSVGEGSLHEELFEDQEVELGPNVMGEVFLFDGRS